MPKTHPNPCQLCPGSCCDDLAVTLNLVDVARIHRALHIPVHDFLARYVDDDPRERPYAFFIRKLPIALALLPPEEKDRGCSFLLDIGGHRRCGIYDIRPGTCRVYPFTDQGNVVKHKRGTLCPRRFDLDEVDHETIRREIEEYQREWNIHAAFAREWNESPPKHPSFEKLLDFVAEIVYGGRV
jgi:Fe-S-cluster containining protein